MIVFALIVITLLVMATALFIVPVMRGERGELATSRDALNKAFYHHRLSELEQDEEQGVVTERPLFIRELQENLLSDIPGQTASTARPIARWTLAPGVILLLVITCGFYLYAGGLGQVSSWHQVMKRMPELRAQVADENAKPLTMADIQDLGLGLRSDLQANPDNARDWLMLGRVGMALNNASTATQAFARAYQLSPEDLDIKLGYADVLTRSGDPQDNINGGNILRSMLAHQQGNLQVLSLLAYNEYQQGHYPQAIGAWQVMLKILPVDDKRIEMVKASIAQAQAKSGMDKVKLAVAVTLSAKAQQQLPQQGTVFISVTDGSSPVPVAVKKLPLSRFPLSVTVDDTNAMMAERLLSSLHQLRVRVRISQNGLVTPASGDWYGESPLTEFSGNNQVNIEINQQVP